jgi:hypothetical protein
MMTKCVAAKRSIAPAHLVASHDRQTTMQDAELLAQYPTNSPCHFADSTIASSTGTATNAHGGSN